MHYTIDKPLHGSAEWLNVRWIDDFGAKRVAASDAAAIYDLHPFKSSERYAAEMLSATPPEPKEANDAMERGTRLEPALREWLASKIGKAIHEPTKMYCYGGMIATLDGMTEDGQVVEIKTTTKTWHGALPDHWRIQGVQQAICANVDQITWGIFDSSQTLHLHTQVVSSDEKAEHEAAVKKWLESIDFGIAPDGVRWSYETIFERYPEPTMLSVEVGPKGKVLIEQLRHVKSEAKAYAELEDRLKAEFCELMEGADQATIDGVVAATWRSQKRTSFDSKTFKAENPELASKYNKTNNIRVFLLKGDK